MRLAWITLAPLVIGFVTKAGLAPANSTELHVHANLIVAPWRPPMSSNELVTLNLEFGGDLTARSVGLADVRLLAAEDESGNDLLLRPPKPAIIPSFRVLPAFGNPDTSRRASVQLRCPTAPALRIAHLRGEVDLWVTDGVEGGRAVVEHFRQHPGTRLAHPELERHGITLTYHTFESFRSWKEAHTLPGRWDNQWLDAIERNCFSGFLGDPDTVPRREVTLLVDDPRQKLIRIEFQRADGQTFREIGTDTVSAKTGGQFRRFRFGEAPPQDLRLIAHLDAPGVKQSRPFALTNLWLPYANPPELTAMARVHLQPWPGGGDGGRIAFTFLGGPMTNAMAIRGIALASATDENDRRVELTWKLLNYLSYVYRTRAPLGEFSVPLAEPPRARLLRTLRGSVELFVPSETNGGVVYLTNFWDLPAGSEFSFVLPEDGKVTVRYLGNFNFGEKYEELRPVAIVMNAPRGATEGRDTVGFEVLSANRRVLRSVLEDATGNTIPEWGRLQTTNHNYYLRLRSAPPADARLAIYLDEPAAYQWVKFDARDVPVYKTNH